MICVRYVSNWSSGSGEQDENMKHLQTDGQTERQQWTKTLSRLFSSGELKY